MGNTSGSEFGGIMVRTEKLVYFAGDIVSGNIYLNVVKQGYQGRIVQFTVIGKEKCQWTTGSGKNRQVHRGKNVFYQQTVIIHEFTNDNLPVGQYIFPFQLQLAPNIQGSFNYNFGIIGIIQYKVKAKILSTNSKITHIKNKQEFTVREPIKEIIQSQKQENKVDITTWCCIKQGSSYVNCDIDKNHFFPNEFVTIKVEADNSQCKLNISQISAQLIQRLQLTSNSGRNVTYNIQLNNFIIGTLQSGTKTNPENKSNFQMQLINIKNQTLQLSPSSNGNFVKSTYFIRIKTIFDGCTCCSATPETWIPVTVLAVIPQEYFEPIQQPQDWNPQGFQQTVIKYNENPFSQNEKIALLNEQMKQ